MRKEILFEVVSEFIGSIKPCADSWIDEVRYENQENLIELVLNGVKSLINNAEYKNRDERSVSSIGNRAFEALEEIYDLLDGVI